MPTLADLAYPNTSALDLVTNALIASVPPPLPLYQRPDIVSALAHIWRETGNGTRGTEAGFALDGTPAQYAVRYSVPNPTQQMSAMMQVAPNTFALFHIHPDTGKPEPSPADMSIADGNHLQMYTASRLGLYQYDPTTKRTSKLLNGDGWMKKH